MTDPRNAIQDAVYAALNGAGLTALVDPDDSDSLPYTVFGGGTAIPGELTNMTHEGAEVTHTIVSWATNPDTAQANASTGLAALTNRDAAITVTGYTLSRLDMDFLGEMIKDNTRPNETYWGVPYRVRIVVEQN